MHHHTHLVVLGIESIASYMPYRQEFYQLSYVSCPLNMLLNLIFKSLSANLFAKVFSAVAEFLSILMLFLINFAEFPLHVDDIHLQFTCFGVFEFIG